MPRNDEDFATMMANLTMGIIGAVVVGTVKGVAGVAGYANGWRDANCARCGAKLRVNVKQHGDAPYYCTDCTPFRKPTGGVWEPVETSNPNYVMPGLNMTVAQLGGPGRRPAKHYAEMETGKRRWFVHCIVFHDDGTHHSWNFDPTNGEVFKEHGRPDDLNKVRR